MPNTMLLKETLIKPITFDPQLVTIKVSESIIRMQHHKTILESFGITSLSNLGKLTISGNVVPQPGLTKPDVNLKGNETIFQSAYRGAIIDQKSLRLAPAGGRAVQLKAIPFPQPIPSTQEIPSPLPIKGKITPRMLVQKTISVSIDTAYWAAQEVVLEDNTMVILKHPQKFLIILAEKITVGKNVTFTWERPTITKPAKKKKLNPPAAKPISTSLSGVTGTDGAPGLRGEPGLKGADAPELEVWVLEMNGRPAFDLRGQDGTAGGDGQDGQDGGRGSKGMAGKKDDLGFFCASGAGAGGNGGNGGAAGNGGNGGDGGRGGRFSLYAPQHVINSYLQGFYLTADGGNGGPGGIPGVPGAGGPGGAAGDTVQAMFDTCGPKNGRSAGRPGVQGAAGVAGSPGIDGDRHAEPFSIKAIDPDEFRRKLLEPAIFNTSPKSALAGDIVSIDGKRFTKTDKVLVNGVQAETLVFSDTKLQFTVPSISGGSHAVQVKQTDHTLSNRGSLYIMPQLFAAGQSRVRPGTRVRLSGSGFTRHAMVKVNDQNMEDVIYISPTELEFKITRPINIEESPAGEKAFVKVVLEDGTPSNEIELMLETYQMVIFGDSIQWGQGLMEHEKFHSLVAAAVQVREGGIGFYKDVLAHSGAIIGANNTEVHPRLPGEVPSKFPTILQQVDSFTGATGFVDLILLDGGFNDVGINNVLNPYGPDLAPLAEKAFFKDMVPLLVKTANKFKNAKIIVTGYYQPLSEQSNTLLIQAMLVALGISFGGLPVGTISAILSEAEKQKIITRSKQIMELSKLHLQNAVHTVNAQLQGEDRIFFADPNFGSFHAALSNDPFIYGININLSPEDINVAPSRNIECIASNQKGIDLDLCRIASVGHPNPKGAKAYADAIIQLL